MIIGIDLGTTHSVAAYMTDDGAKLVPNALGETLTPSVVAIEEDGRLIIGREAQEYSVLHPERSAAQFKRHMGSEWTCNIGNQTHTPETLSSLILRALKEDAVAHLGSPVEEAVITVPAYFNELQRKATMKAGEMAGFKVHRIINEPTAAAIAYGLHETDSDKLVAVLDLGGGTFDISIVELFEGSVEVRASSGESFLGGEDFTKTLAARALETQGCLFEHSELEHPQMVSRMLQLCERAKRQLTRQNEVCVRIPDCQGEVKDDCQEITVSREQFATWTDHILARIELPIRRGLGDAGLRRQDIDEVILVGGATRMNSVVHRVTELFGKEPTSRHNPDEVVALGAAVQAGLMSNNASLDDMVVTDVSPFTLGVEISKRIGSKIRHGYFQPIINRNTTIPVSRVERVQTMHANQSEVEVKIFQGECRKVGDNLLLGEFVVRGLPRGPAGQDVDLRFTYDLNGVLEVEATIVQTQRKTSLVITKHARNLDESAVQRAINEMQELKTHPRDEAVFRMLMKRAERLYRELPLVEREILAEIVDEFESALEMQEKDLIAQHQVLLESFLDRFEMGQEDDNDSSW